MLQILTHHGRLVRYLFSNLYLCSKYWKCRRQFLKSKKFNKFKNRIFYIMGSIIPDAQNGSIKIAIGRLIKTFAVFYITLLLTHDIQTVEEHLQIFGLVHPENKILCSNFYLLTQEIIAMLLQKVLHFIYLLDCFGFSISFKFNSTLLG